MTYQHERLLTACVFDVCLEVLSTGRHPKRTLSHGKRHQAPAQVGLLYFWPSHAFFLACLSRGVSYSKSRRSLHGSYRGPPVRVTGGGRRVEIASEYCSAIWSDVLSPEWSVDMARQRRASSSSSQPCAVEQSSRRQAPGMMTFRFWACFGDCTWRSNACWERCMLIRRPGGEDEGYESCSWGSIALQHGNADSGSWSRDRISTSQARLRKERVSQETLVRHVGVCKGGDVLCHWYGVLVS
jgi:hypothetical protein